MADLDHSTHVGNGSWWVQVERQETRKSVCPKLMHAKFLSHGLTSVIREWDQLHILRTLLRSEHLHRGRGEKIQKQTLSYSTLQFWSGEFQLYEQT